MKRNGRAGYAYEFSNKLDGKTKSFLRNLLRTSDVLRPTSIVKVLEEFYSKIKYDWLVIWFVSKKSLPYELVINPKEIYVRRDYEELLLEMRRGNNGEIKILMETGEGLRALQNILGEIFQRKVEARI